MRTSSFALLLVALLGACCPHVASTPTLHPVPPEPTPPTPAPPEPGALNRGVVELQIAGVDVIYKRRPANDIVVVDIKVRGGCRNMTRQDAGIETLALTVGTEGGTATLDKDQLAARLEGLGSSVVASPDRDYSTVGLRTIKQTFGDAWAVFDDVLRNPTFPDDQVTLHKDRQIAAIQQIPDNPDRLVGQLSNQAAFQGHPYLNRQLGFVDSVEPLDAAKLREYWRGLLTRDRMLVVVVGDLEEADLRAKLEATLSALPAHGARGPWADAPPPALGIGSAAVEFHAQELPTTYVLGLFDGPPAPHADYAPLVMGVRVLSNRFFEEVRTKRNLSYAVSARLFNSYANFGQIYTTAQDPRATVGVMFQEIQRLRDEPVSDRDLQDQINLYVTGYYMDLQTNDAQADLLAHWEIVAGGREYADQMLDRLRAVTAADVQRVAREYLQHFRFGVVGPQVRYDAAFYRSR
jgi:zinc protease